ncbi:LpqN/LpqT family lipoprotein [soil metagenome]
MGAMRTVIMVSVLTIVGLGTGCGSPTEGAPVADHNCVETSVPLTLVSPQSEAEPELRVPQPAGWETSDELTSALTRFAMVNTDLTAQGFAPNALVTFEAITGESSDADQVFNQQREVLERQLGATAVSTESGLQCGYPAQTISYTAPVMGNVPERQSKVLCVLADVDGTNYLTTLTLSTVDPGNGTYTRDSADILAGFQVNG